MAKAIKKVNKLPKGFRRSPGATARAPKGYYHADNGESYFSGKRKHILVKERYAKTPKEMTKKELAEELYVSYVQTGSTPIGRKTPLTKQEFIKRHLKGAGGVKGFSKPQLEQMVTRERNGTGIYARQINKGVRPSK